VYLVAHISAVLKVDDTHFDSSAKVKLTHSIETTSITTIMQKIIVMTALIVQTLAWNPGLHKLVDPKSLGTLQKEEIGRNLAFRAFEVLLVPSIANAYTFDPIPRESRPDATDAAITYSGIKPDFVALRRDIDDIIREMPAKGPTLVRLGWHASGTYDKMTNTGGSNGGTIHFKEELAHGANAGLDTAQSWLEPIYKKYNKAADLSYADLYTLAAAQAIVTMGGPPIPWRAGRIDFQDASKVTPDGRLPDADKGSPQETAAHIRRIFNRMGFNDQEIVALAGAHALGRCHPTVSGYMGPWSPTPTTFNNAYFNLLLNMKWKPNQKSPKFQYEDPSGRLMMLPSDLALIEDYEFKKYVQIYAKDNNKFFADFSDAFSKLLELGTHELYEV
jgi:cytochrome c peroxidase